jgi:hypothetical protein
LKDDENLKLKKIKNFWKEITNGIIQWK